MKLITVGIKDEARSEAGQSYGPASVAVIGTAGGQLLCLETGDDDLLTLRLAKPGDDIPEGYLYAGPVSDCYLFVNSLKEQAQRFVNERLLPAIEDVQAAAGQPTYHTSLAALQEVLRSAESLIGNGELEFQRAMAFTAALFLIRAGDTNGARKLVDLLRKADPQGFLTGKYKQVQQRLEGIVQSWPA